MGRPRNGYRLKSGDPVPGVTTITGRFGDKGGIIMWAHKRGVECPDEPLYAARDDAAAIGTLVHEMWEAHLKGAEMPEFPRTFTEAMRGQARKAFDSAIRWKEDNNLLVTPHERPLVSEKHGYGGTPDAVARGKRGGSLADWKSSKSGFYLETWLQMAAYLGLIEECEPDTDLSDGVHLVRFGKIGGEFEHLHIPRDHPGLLLAHSQFLRLRDAWGDDKILKDLT